MKKSLLAIGMLLVLSGCTMFHHHPHDGRANPDNELARREGFDARLVAQPQPNDVNVFIVDSKIIVGQEPVRPRGDSSVQIWWILDKSSPYKFPANGIEFAKGPDELKCGLQGISGKVFICKYKRPASGTRYKYTVRVMDGSGKLLEELDPWVYSP